MTLILEVSNSNVVKFVKELDECEFFDYGKEESETSTRFTFKKCTAEEEQLLCMLKLAL